MKVLFVDTSVAGHHIPYMSCLTSSEEYESVLALPEEADIPCRQCLFTLRDGFFSSENGKRKFSAYYAWLRDIKEIADKEKPDIVHFLMGDDFYRFFGLGLNLFKKYNVVVTLHWLRDTRAGIMSTKAIAHFADKIVVHSAYIKQLLHNKGIRNIEHIEYPCFEKYTVEKEKALAYFDLDGECPVIGCIGNTREDKGLDILLEALNEVRVPFQLLIAGKPVAFDEIYIKEHSRSFQNRVHTCMHFLSNDELGMALTASDIIALPYKKVFNGASGPLEEGVSMGKCIIGPNHGNLGNTINQNHLGHTFETENSKVLAGVLETALHEKFVADNVYIQYKVGLNPETFQKAYLSLYKSIEK